MNTINQTEGAPISWMRRLVAEWIPTADPNRLAKWLSGVGLPPVGDDEEPYVWLLRGLPKGGPRAEAEVSASKAVAALLDKEVDRTESDGLLFNLFFLAAGLSTPDELTGALDRVLQRESLRGRTWRGISLVDALRAALIENQVDPRHWLRWQTMLAGEPDPYLGGTVMSGFEGTLWMPPGVHLRGTPSLSQLGEALRRVAHFLDSTPALIERREREFKTCLRRAKSGYPDAITNPVLVHLADKAAWPEWAVYCLDLGFITKFPGDESMARLVISKYNAKDVQMATPAILMCNAEVVVIRGRNEELRSLEAMVQPAELERRQTDYKEKLTIKDKSPEPSLGEPAPPIAPRLTRRAGKPKR